MCEKCYFILENINIKIVFIILILLLNILFSSYQVDLRTYIFNFNVNSYILTHVYLNLSDANKTTTSKLSKPPNGGKIKFINPQSTFKIALECSIATGTVTAKSEALVKTDNYRGTLTCNKTAGIFVAGSIINTNTCTAKDASNNSFTTFTRGTIVQGIITPRWTIIPNTLNTTLESNNLEGPQIAQGGTPAATDNCSGTETNPKTSGIIVAGSCANSGIYTDIWRVKLVCSNSSTTFTELITIQDTTGITLTGISYTVVAINYYAFFSPATIVISHNFNSNKVIVIYTETKSVFENVCSTNYILTCKYTASECSNNTTSYTQVITVEVTTSPTVTDPVKITGLQNIINLSVANLGTITNTSDNYVLANV
jgi:hypothetical protein